MLILAPIGDRVCPFIPEYAPLSPPTTAPPPPPNGYPPPPPPPPAPSPDLSTPWAPVQVAFYAVAPWPCPPLYNPLPPLPPPPAATIT